MKNSLRSAPNSDRQRMVSSYIVGEKIGSGSFATVWLARHKTTGKCVAIKSISRTKLNVNKKHQTNLESEISIMKRLDHPNIVRLFDIEITDRHIYLILEFCDGGDLSHYIRKHGPLTEKHAQIWLKQLASGLLYVRNRNLIHRDLKPQNLLLSEGPDGSLATLKIADFGFARYIQPESLAATLCGSPLYMAPEILKVQKYDAKADLWSVGTILFEMVTGKPPFNAATHYELIKKIEHGMLRFPAEVKISANLLDLLQRLLKRNPMQRMSFDQFFCHPFVDLKEELMEEMKASQISAHHVPLPLTSPAFQKVPKPQPSAQDRRKTLPVKQPVRHAPQRKFSLQLHPMSLESMSGPMATENPGGRPASNAQSVSRFHPFRDVPVGPPSAVFQSSAFGGSSAVDSSLAPLAVSRPMSESETVAGHLSLDGSDSGHFGGLSAGRSISELQHELESDKNQLSATEIPTVSRSSADQFAADDGFVLVDEKEAADKPAESPQHRPQTGSPYQKSPSGSPIRPEKHTICPTDSTHKRPPSGSMAENVLTAGVTEPGSQPEDGTFLSEADAFGEFKSRGRLVLDIVCLADAKVRNSASDSITSDSIAQGLTLYATGLTMLLNLSKLVGSYLAELSVQCDVTGDDTNDATGDMVLGSAVIGVDEPTYDDKIRRLHSLLLERYEYFMNKAKSLRGQVEPSQLSHCVEKLLYDEAMQLARQAAVDEVMAKNAAAYSKYTKATRFLQLLLGENSCDQYDADIINSYLSEFQNRISALTISSSR
eukprot:162986_1